MFEVSDASAKTFQIHNFSIDGFDGTIGKAIVVDFSCPMFFIIKNELMM